ncbi:galactose-binding domain-containing protein [Kribbella deserti]|uniref:Discoidin domain-containing protein n=1 Tax=Kribbella deserti TaxID=1926257 RepID=A0ABV6QW28_9ACTN
MFPLRKIKVPVVALAAVVIATSVGLHASAGVTADVLLSRGAPVITSSVESSSFLGKNAVDGSTSTRWASAEYIDPQWIRVDLGQPSAVNRLKLNWEVAYAKSYRIEISDDGANFRTLKTITTGDGGIDDHTGLAANGRYVRVVGTQRGTPWGYSLWEMEVFGVSGSTGDTQAPTVPTNLAAGTVTSTTVDLTWTASTDNVGVSGYDVFRNGTFVASVAENRFSDTALTPQTAYSYTVLAKDPNNNKSAQSAPLSVTTAAGPTGVFVLAAAGDIADQCTASSSSCVHPKTAKVVDFIKPVNVITMGDNQYDDAHYSDFTSYFNTSWGRFKSIMKPSVGNHETYSSPAYDGYHRYFGAIARPNGKRYYSWERGNWHFIALDSTEDSPGLVESAQHTWLKADLAANTKKCVAAYFHHPRFSSGARGDNDKMATMWNILVDNKVDLVLNGHDHHYERFVAQDKYGKPTAAGTTMIIGGMGGTDNFYPVHAEHEATAKTITDTHGVIKLTMTDNSFTSQLIGLNNTVLDSSPTTTCH